MAAGLYVPLQLPRAYRRVTRKEGSIPIPIDGDSNPLRIDPAGTLLGLLLSVHGTITCDAGATSPANHPEAPYNLIKRVTLSGDGNVVAVGGTPLVNLERAREADFVPSNVFAGVGGVGQVVTPFSFDLHVPVCVRDGDLYGEWSDYLGCIFTGDNKLSLQLEVQGGDEGDVFTTHANTAHIAGTIDVYSFKLDTPAPDADPTLLAAISWKHRLIEEQSGVQINGAGELGTVADLPTGSPRAYLRILDIIRNNGAPDGTIVESINAEIQDTIEFERNVDNQAWKARQSRRYIVGLPAGMYVTDFSAGNRRDNWLPVGGVSIFRVRPTISAGAVLVGATLARYTEVVEPSSLAAKFMQAAAARGKKATAGA